MKCSVCNIEIEDKTVDSTRCRRCRLAERVERLTDEIDRMTKEMEKLKEENRSLKEDGRCIPIEVHLYGMDTKKIEIQPEPYESHEAAYDGNGNPAIRKMILKPGSPTGYVRLGAGKEIHIKAWTPAHSDLVGAGPYCDHGKQIRIWGQKLTAATDEMHQAKSELGTAKRNATAHELALAGVRLGLVAVAKKLEEDGKNDTAKSITDIARIGESTYKRMSYSMDLLDLVFSMRTATTITDETWKHIANVADQAYRESHSETR